MIGRNQQTDVSRRDFVKAGLTAAAVAGLPSTAVAAQPDGKDPTDDKEPKKQDLVPTRVLGRTGVRVSMLNFGAGRGASPRMLNAVYDAGIRYIDTAASYAGGESEKQVGKWMAKKGCRREFLIVTKTHGANTPDEWVKAVDQRLEALQTDYLDLYFFHGAGGGGQDDGGERDRTWPKLKKWAKAADKLKKSGKVRFVGFSTHTSVPLRIALLNNAAAGGWVDAIMLSYDPQLVRENKRFDKALDKCHKAGIGLVSMKEMRAAMGNMSKFLPDFDKMGLTAPQAVLHAVWSDERIASICSDMPNLRILKENTDAAKKFKPLDKKTMGAVLGLYDRVARTFCNGCDGRCRRAGKTKAALNDITRCLSYYEMDGSRDEARRAYAALTPQQRDWHDADLAAASAACISKLDFASLLSRAEAKLA
ncbi:MAG: aldo/keto reductase [Phycisphaerae bacterium]|nr:aldo/keto reductase [Phycisphaerae bacterium]